MAFAYGSRLLLTDVLENRNPTTGELVQPPFVDIRQRVDDPASDDSVVLYDQTDHWAGLGLKHLSDANAWWVIADLSGVVDPFEELTEAAQLRIPSATRFHLQLTPSKRGDF